MRRKRTNIEIEQSIIHIQDWIIDGVSNSEIIHSCIANEWCTSTRHAEKLIKRAKDRWVKEQDAELLERRIIKEKELIALKDKLSRKYRGHPAGILAIARIEGLIIKLMGLAAPASTVIQHTGLNGGPIVTKVVDNIDYDALPVEVLKALADARKTRD